MGKLEYTTHDGTYTGLTDDEVKVSRAASGANMLTQHERRIWTIFSDVLLDPMMLLLLVACSIYFFTNKPQEGIIMTAALLIIAAISIFQSFRTERAMQALKKLSQPYTTVIRNSKKRLIPSENIVVGDIIIVSEGQQITADAEILEYNDISVDESILTGESFPVEKDTVNNQLFSGTTVSSGLAHARVTAVGNNTRIGKLGVTMEQTHKEQTPLQRQVRLFVRRMTVIGLITFAFITVFNALKADSWMAGLMEGLTLAMAIIPEEIPVALSTFMALGAYRMMKINVLVKQPQTVEALGAATVICIDKTGTITENKMKVQELFDVGTWSPVSSEKKGKEASELLFYARLASEPVPFDPMEKAIVEAFEAMKLSVDDYKMINEYPLSGRPPFMTHVYTDNYGKRIIACKGAPEGIIKNSLLSEDDKQKIKRIQEEMAAKGNRVLAIATTDYADRVLPASQEAFQWRVLGLLGLYDPPKKNMPGVINNFHDAGIAVKMITGDYPQTASGIAKQVGIKEPDTFVTGDELMRLDEEKLMSTVKNTNIFARVQPEMKLRIIQALKADNEVVAMTGDGVNDGPALKAAHIGIAVGEKGSEVARQAASLVLVNGDLASMVDAVALGRKIYSNLKKAIQYIITIHVPILSFVIFPLLLGWEYSSLLKPVHIIFLELIMGPTCSIVYENEPIEEILMQQKPRKFSTTFFSLQELSVSLLQGAVVAICLLASLYYCIYKAIDIETTRTIIFSNIIFSNIMLTIVGRSKVNNIFTTFRYENKMIAGVILLQLLLLVLFINYDPLRSIFGFKAVPVYLYGINLLISIISVGWIEFFKRGSNK